MINLQDHSNDLLLFAQIVRSGSLSAAASQLGIGRSSASKRLMALENKVGSRLLQRTTRKMSLTEVGEEILIEAHKIEQALTTVASISENHQQVYTGRVKLSCTSGIGRRLLVPLLNTFTEQYPNIAINLQLEDRFVDIIKEQVDVSIRVDQLSDSTLIARQLGDLRWVLCASPKYLDVLGEPKTPADLKRHSCLCYQNSQASMNTWTFQKGDIEEQVTVTGGLSMNDADALVSAAVDGHGVLMIDHVMCRDAMEKGELVELLPDYTAIGGLPVYLVYPAREFVPARVQVLINYLLAEMRPLI